MLLMLPVLTLAQAKIITYTTTPMIEDGKDISILITFINSGTNTIHVPLVGGSDEYGYVSSVDPILFSASIYTLVDNEPCSIGGMGSGYDLKIDKTQPLPPGGKITYKETWQYKFDSEWPKDTSEAMFVLTPRFNSFDFNIPCITLYYKKQSNNEGIDAHD